MAGTPGVAGYIGANRQFAIFSSLRPITERIYLDHAATSPLRPQALAAMEEGFRLWANPSSPHAEGRKARSALEDARMRIKRSLGWESEVIFTSGASEALAIAITRSKTRRTFISAVEHDAVLRAARDAALLSVENGTTALPDDLSQALIAIQQINPETGAVLLCDNESYRSISEGGGLLLADCSQSAGKLDLPECDMAVVSAHKLGGPVGIGALLVRDFALLEPVGGHERGYRAGTENLPGALGFAAAVEAASEERTKEFAEVQGEFARKMAPWRLLTGENHVDHILALTHPTTRAQALLIRFDALGFAVSAGSACSSGTLKKSRVLEGFGVEDDVAARTIRISLGWSTTQADVDSFADAWLGSMQ